VGLPEVLLSLLREPMSGTDLIRLFDGTIRHFWQTDLSQIYRALDALERDGSVRSQSHPSARGPAKRVYRLTPAGRRRLAAWLREPPEIPAAKFEYLARIFSMTADPQPMRRARELLTALREDAAREVAILEAVETAFKRDPGYPAGLPTFLFYPWLTLRHGLLRRRALVAWIDESLACLADRPADRDAMEPDALKRLIEAQSNLEVLEGVP
jgi:DNA-binding PadR family transcriptional regulator